MHDMHQGLLGVSGQGVSLGSAQNATARWEEIDMKDPAGKIWKRRARHGAKKAQVDQSLVTGSPVAVRNGVGD